MFRFCWWVFFEVCLFCEQYREMKTRRVYTRDFGTPPDRDIEGVT
jgi:hypothetical protein